MGISNAYSPRPTLLHELCDLRGLKRFLIRGDVRVSHTMPLYARGITKRNTTANEEAKCPTLLPVPGFKSRQQ